MSGLSGRLANAVRRLRDRASPRPPQRLTLRITPELGALRTVADARTDFASSGPDAVTAVWATGGHVDTPDLQRRLEGRTGGEDRPDWHDGLGGGPIYDVHIHRLRDVLHAPEFGAVIDQDGRVMKASIGEALFLTPTLAALPGVTMDQDRPVLTVPRRLPHLTSAAVFMAWGGRFNYGHFLIDCISGLAALDRAGLLDDRPLVTPPLTAWQREMIGLLLGPEGLARVHEISAPLIRIDDVVYASTMDHFLHAPNSPLDWVRDQILAKVDLADGGQRRLYVSRRGDDKRRMVNEAELETALVARGFTVVHPQALSVAQQVALFRDADVVVAPTGAALANALFCKPGTKVFEILPSNFVGIWTRGLCHLAGVDWHGYFAPSPLQEQDVLIGGVLQPGMSFQWRTPLEPFLEFLDARL